MEPCSEILKYDLKCLDAFQMNHNVTSVSDGRSPHNETNRLDETTQRIKILRKLQENSERKRKFLMDSV